MSLASQFAGAVARAYHKPRREKMFGEGRAIPLDRNAKARVAAYARALSHRTEKGKHYGVLTDKFLTVLRVLLWDFHNAGNGRCFPSYESIAEHAHCGRTTVYQAINALDRAGILTWVNRIARIRECRRQGARPPQCVSARTYYPGEPRSCGHGSDRQPSRCLDHRCPQSTPISARDGGRRSAS